jgi:hypothetical protein
MGKRRGGGECRDCQTVCCDRVATSSTFGEQPLPSQVPELHFGLGAKDLIDRVSSCSFKIAAAPPTKDALGDDFREIRQVVLGPEDHRHWQTCGGRGRSRPSPGPVDDFHRIARGHHRHARAFTNFARATAIARPQAAHNSYNAIVLHVWHEHPLKKLMILNAPPLPGVSCASQLSWTRL